MSILFSHDDEEVFYSTVTVPIMTKRQARAQSDASNDTSPYKNEIPHVKKRRKSSPNPKIPPLNPIIPPLKPKNPPLFRNESLSDQFINMNLNQNLNKDENQNCKYYQCTLNKITIPNSLFEQEQTIDRAEICKCLAPNAHVSEAMMQLHLNEFRKKNDNKLFILGKNYVTFKNVKLESERIYIPILIECKWILVVKDSEKVYIINNFWNVDINFQGINIEYNSINDEIDEYTSGVLLIFIIRKLEENWISLGSRIDLSKCVEKKDVDISKYIEKYRYDILKLEWM